MKDALSLDARTTPCIANSKTEVHRVAGEMARQSLEADVVKAQTYFERALAD
jgi:hypothetical protein